MEGVIDPIHLADRPGTGGHSVSVGVLGRFQPGILTGHDCLDCEIVIRAESVDATSSVRLLPEDPVDWEEALAAPQPGRPGGSCPHAAAREHGMHALRHIYASGLLDAGESIKAVSEYLGHSDPGPTLKVYAHLMPSSRDRARKAIGRALRPQDPGH
ncbi:DUF5959 family protein [Streptomyces sp. NPDC048279]|uniref:DUF5959 family protein n=1 Tax=Streptomyces sp. NPDC048279 TaxID=3154714 RepID=UPI0034154FCF